MDLGAGVYESGLARWIYQHGIYLKFITAVRATKNAFIDTINGQFNDERLNDHFFTSIEHARAAIGAWRRNRTRIGPTTN